MTQHPRGVGMTPGDNSQNQSGNSRSLANKQWDSSNQEARRQNAKRAANLPQRHVEAVGTITPPAAWKKVLATLTEKLDSGFLVGLIGGRGTGKTQAAVELMLQQIDDNKSARYAKAMDLFIDLRSSYSSDATEKSIVNTYVAASLLVVDDVHQRGNSAWEDRVLAHIIDRRYDEKLDTLLISNETPVTFKASMGVTIIDRMQQCGGLIVCDWPSLRAKAAK